jgi:putative SOS response-associated peptidase YedK
VCGRYTLKTPVKALAEEFSLFDPPPSLPPRYNIAPTQPVAAVRQAADGGGRELVRLRWGLIPSWADDPKIGYRLINARAETAADKPAFRSAFRHRRCLVPADGFYEWRPVNGKKQPYYICRRDGGPFAFAGLWEQWQGADGEVIESCTLLTTPANDLVRPIHERMPVILKPEAYAPWLDPHSHQPERLHPLLRPYPGEEMTTYPVSHRVNNPRNDDPQCAEPAA